MLGQWGSPLIGKTIRFGTNKTEKRRYPITIIVGLGHRRIALFTKSSKLSQSSDLPLSRSDCFLPVFHFPLLILRIIFRFASLILDVSIDAKYVCVVLMELCPMPSLISAME